MKHTTTSTLPAGLQARYEITEPLSGGPVFALPHYGQGSVDFSRMTDELAEALIAAGFPYLRRVVLPSITDGHHRAKKGQKASEPTGEAGTEPTDELQD